MSAVILSITTGKRIPDNYVVSDEKIVSDKIKYALRHCPPMIVGLAISQGLRRLSWPERSVQEAIDAGIAWGYRQLLKLPDPPEAA